jgi:hypothetical protein
LRTLVLTGREAFTKAPRYQVISVAILAKIGARGRADYDAAKLLSTAAFRLRFFPPAEAENARIQNRLEAGCCVTCGAPREGKSIRLCNSCQETYNRVYNARRLQREKEVRKVAREAKAAAKQRPASRADPYGYPWPHQK